MILSDGSPALAAASGRNPLRTSLLIGLCCFVLFNLNGRSISAGDTYPARYIPFAVVQHHTVFMNPVAKVAAQGRGEGAFWMLHRPGGELMSLYPIVVPVVVSPLYVPAVAYLHLRGWTDARFDFVARLMEKLVASLLASLSVALLYLLLRRRVSERNALLLTFAFAFGTTTWTISAQALWQHGLAQLLVVAVLLLLTAPYRTRSAIAVGLLCGLIACNRPPDVVLAAALGLYALFWAGEVRRIVLLTVAALVPGIAVLFYNIHVGGNVLGGYGVIGKAQFFNHSLLAGIAGLLVSPTRGLFLYSPFLLFALLAWRYAPAARDERRLTIVMIAAFAVQVALYGKVDWRGGWSWGPRYMTDVLPFLFWMLAPVVAALRGAMRTVFVALVGVAVAMQAIGAFCYTGALDSPLFTEPPGPHEMDAAWRWRNAPYVTSLQRGPAPFELLTETRGAIDGVEVGGKAVASVAAGQPAEATGWALAGSASPAQVALLVDGKLAAPASTFVDRPDVRRALDVTSPAGWRIPINTASLAPGPHRLTLFAWTSMSGEDHFIDERTLTIAPAPAGAAAPRVVVAGEEDLAADAQQAAAHLRDRQNAEGYWLTTYTSGTSYRDPHPEMNTFLTSLLVDVLHPVAAANGLAPNLERARQHLTRQIERTGLVRYHGLPSGATIGTLGCVITPDTDDTALVWRLAPAPDRARLDAALATIAKYHTPEGLYRSWLAPREQFQCLDPGSDPNPADIAIQMHLLLLLAEARPAQAHALCEALRPLVDQDRVWVYYRKTPLVPTLRIADLHRAGCDLELPESRMQTSVAGQEIWESIIRMLGRGTAAGSSAPDRVLVRAVLRELARDDFALIRTNPPLFYHNDLTATVSRYYWSEDFGYALWLRLLDDYERLH